ncbi:transcription antitermination factor NusB [Thermoflavimicrobium dichotomicum]|nr:transcription antitermination factor NusB [Thermoflavimicrobium dichotomicum]
MSEVKAEMSRRYVRECVLQALYQMEFHPDQEDSVIKERGENLEGEYKDFYHYLIRGVKEHLSTIDATIERYLKKGWSLERIAAVDRAILRIAVFELLFEEETPKGVILNEAVELAKVYSGEESRRFVNGILGNVASDDE